MNLVNDMARSREAHDAIAQSLSGQMDFDTARITTTCFLLPRRMLTFHTRLKVAYARIMHQLEMNDFMLQSDICASRSMDMDGWVGGLWWGKDWVMEGIMMRSTTFVFSVVDLPWFGVFLVFLSWGANGFAVIPLPITKACQEVLCVFCFYLVLYSSHPVFGVEKSCFKHTATFVSLFPFALSVLI
jgi:hypothetical protein